MKFQFLNKLPTPLEIKQKYPLSNNLKEIKRVRDLEVANIFRGQVDKFILIIGPCSAHDREAVLKYVEELAKLQDTVKEKIVIIPRIYTNKPRTTGAGYKGLLHQPDPTKAPDMLAGLTAIRQLHIDVIKNTGFTTADEMLYPENHRYLNDILGYVAVGARSVENQFHRLTASGVGIPCGMKNPTSGDLGVMLNSIKAAQDSHTFIYRGWEVATEGNPLAHAILRGYVDFNGESYPNYHYEDLAKLHEIYLKQGLLNPAAIVDVNHANSGKKYKEQIRITKEILYSRSINDNINTFVKGLMVESYLLGGAQGVDGKEFGKSITDPCISIEDTKYLINFIAEHL